jgi:hypothetical protein
MIARGFVDDQYLCMMEGKRVGKPSDHALDRLLSAVCHNEDEHPFF